LIYKILNNLKLNSSLNAIICGDEIINRKDLDNKVNTLAYYLKEKKVKKGEIVTVLLSPSIEFIISILAILKTGAAYVPISINFPKEKIKNIIKTSGSNFSISSNKKESFLENTSCENLMFETLDFDKKLKLPQIIDYL
jgi:acyl-coenzyme A synthetase/AMP-(fatty) acid ligase